MNKTTKILFDKVDSEFLFFIILGLDEICAWQGYRKTLAVEKLSRIDTKIL